MDWMYKANDKGVNSEDYLLGKEVDSAILDAQKEEQLEEQVGSCTCRKRDLLLFSHASH